MLHDWGVIAAAFAYIGLLFGVASYGDRLSPSQRGRASMLIYPLSLAIYCTSWTFFGSVGFATRTSIDFLAIYVGPILMIGLCTPLLRRVIQLAKSQNITSIADFIAARYGKSQAVAATVALIAIVGSVPYIALQLKAMASSLETILSEDKLFSSIPIVGDIALIVMLAMAVFAVLFGTRQADATEHQHGLMLAIATESIVKLVAFLAVGMYVLALPMEANSQLLSVIVFVGGLSAATAMVIVECVALSIMVSNDIVLPLVLPRSEQSRSGGKDFSDFLLRVRRFAIFAIMVMAYFYYRALGNTQLAAIGLLSFAAIAQLAPAFFGGLIWRRATARGAMGGMLVGVAVWIYTLFLPSFLEGNTAGLLLLQHGPFGIEALRPQALFGADRKSTRLNSSHTV